MNGKSPYLKKLLEKKVQKHHRSRDPEIIEKVFKGEHWILVQLERRRYLSKGFLRCLKQYVLDREDQAIDLEEEESGREDRPHGNP